MVTNAGTHIAASVLDAMEARFPELPRSLLALTLESHWPRTDEAQAAMDRLRRSYSPWLLITVVVVTTATAVAASTTMERLAALGVAELLIVAYFILAWRAKSRPRAFHAVAVVQGAEQSSSAQ